jgi:hypothetical protein
MFSARTLEILLILTICIMVATGCTERPAGTPQSGPAGYVPDPDNSSGSVTRGPFWIQIDPGQGFFGDEEIRITGTTNLPPDEEIWIHITAPGTGYTGNFRATGIPLIRSRRASGSTNWSATTNATNLLPVSRQPYSVTAYAANHPEARNSSIFFVSGAHPIVVGTPYTFSGKVPDEECNAVLIWVLGPSYAKVSLVPVSPGGTFTYTMSEFETGRLNVTENRTDFHIIVQYLSPQDQVDLTAYTQAETWLYDTQRHRAFNLTDLRSMSGTDLRKYLAGNLQWRGRATFHQYDVVAEKAWLIIDPPGDQSNDHVVDVTGSTNIPAGGKVHMVVDQVTFPSFACACGKCPNNSDHRHEYIRIVQGPQSINSLHMQANVTGFKPDTYGILAFSMDGNAMAEQSFNITGRDPVTATTSSPSAGPSGSTCV